MQNEKIVVVGYGWVGQANALALVKMGYMVGFYDTASELTFHYKDEHETYAKVHRVVDLKDIDGEDTYYIVCVGDIVSEERDQDISRIKSACDMLKSLKGKVVLRSTVLPQKLKELEFHFYLPEFLHEKNAVEECLTPYYYVIGTRGDISLPSFLKSWEARSYKSFHGTPEEASYIKYLSNIWNTIRIAFVNEFGDSMGDPKTAEDVRKIERVIDFVLERKSYVRYGQGFDGHCLPKDTRAFIGAHIKEGKNVDMLIGAYSSNEYHKKLQEKLQTLPKVFSFWDYSNSPVGAVAVFWHAVNEISAVKAARKHLRFVSDAAFVLVPERSMKRSKDIWEKKAKENALYYANTYTSGGRGVTDKELTESGSADYEEFIINDPLLNSLRNLGKEKKVLEFGSGVGRMTEFFAKEFGSVHSLDLSPTMVARARSRVKAPNVSFEVFDGGFLPYKDGSFDLIFSYQTLQYVPTHKDLERYMHEFCRTLKEGGVAKVQLRGGRGVKRWEWSYGASYTPEEARRLAERAGFRILDEQVQGIKHIWLTLQKRV